MRNPFQAVGSDKWGHFRTPGTYPTVPATWPNRAVRRAVIYGRKLPQEWAAFFVNRPALVKFIKTGRAPAAWQ